VFHRSGSQWTHQAYLKASNTDANDMFGTAVSLSTDGNTLAVSTPNEDSAATDIDGDQADNSAADAGAVYVFTRSGSAWAQAAYVKATNTEQLDAFGWAVSCSGDGLTVAIGGFLEDGSGTGYGGNPSSNARDGSGAVYVIRNVGGTWAHDSYIKALNTGVGDGFGDHVAVSANGATLAVSSWGEKSAATGVDGDMTDNSAKFAGAVYVYE
jgi:hypothetical protein